MMNWTYGYDGGMMGAFGLGGFVLMVLWWVAIVYAVAWAVRWTLDGIRHDRRRHGTALDILKERYAKGEIDKREFDEKKKDVEGR